MKNNKKAFTLVELLLAAGLMTIVFTIVLSIATSVLSIWNKTSGEVKAIGEANMVLNQIQEDFESIVIKQDDSIWLQVAYPESVGCLTGSYNVNDESNVVPFMPPDIMFYSNTKDRPRYTSDASEEDPYARTPIAGYLCAMRYKLAVKSPFMQSTADNAQQNNAFYGFYRAILDPKSTFENALGSSAQGIVSSTESSASDISNALYTFWTNGFFEVLNETGNYDTVALNTWTLAPQNFFVPNIVDLKTTFTVKYRLKNTSNFYDEYAYATIPAGVPFALSNKLYIEESLYVLDDSGEKTYVSPEEAEDASLAYVDISITVLTKDGQKDLAARMKSGSRIVNEKDFKRIVRQNSITLVKRIPFIGDAK